MRRDLAPGASPPLNPVIWDYEIGANLRAWPPCSGSSPTRPAGTSTLYGSIDARMTVDELLNAMVDSRQFYNLATNECSRGTGQCLGYTNMVQRGVARVACVMPMDSACDPPDALGAGIQEKWRHWACTFAPLPDDKIKPY